MTPRITIFLIASALSLPFWWGINLSQNTLEKFLSAQISQPFEEMSFVKIPPKSQKPKLELNARAALSIKLKETGREILLFEKNSEAAFPIASLSKLMTAVIVLENPRDYDFSKVLTIFKEAALKDNVPNHGNLKEGEQFTVKKLLDLMLVYSSNHAAFAISEVLGEENFTEKMNKKASELGLRNTNFVNSTGLDPEDLHYDNLNQPYFNFSSARDLITLAEYILRTHPLIFETTAGGGLFPIVNGISEISIPKNSMLIGGKTGYTDEALGGMLLVTSNEKGDAVINVILGAPSAKDRIIEMQKLIDYK
ncbi:MAG: serine hydrolase [Candidatus Wildermuthbacteria bacterium]|nr:serine hydrolase [Candidatus Wildermuthbacteria bacterium]